MITAYRPDDIKPFYPATLDIETSSIGKLLKIGFAYQDEHDERIYNTFDTWGAFLAYLLVLISKYRHNRVLLHRINRIWAHNGANFDWLHLVEYIRDNDLAKDTKYVMSDSAGIGVVIKLHSKETIRLFDSNRLLPGSLDKLCKEFKTNVQKQAVPDYYKSRMELFAQRYNDRFLSYLHDDVLSLQEVIYKFWRMIYELEGSIGYLPMTLPSIAMKIFRKRFRDDQVITVPWNEKVKEFTRRGYTGGRVECYQSGEHKNVKVYDVNSMYPAVMAGNVFPVSSRCAWVYAIRDDMQGFYEIEYEQTNISVPPVLRDESSGEFAYQGKGVYTEVEIAVLKEMGGNVTVNRGLVFQRSEPIFKDFVYRYYDLRLQAQQNNNNALAYVCKILLNSLYGKFGQKGVKTQIEDVKKTRIAEVLKNGGEVHILSEEYMVVKESSVCEHEFTAIAAYVTSYARCVLYRAILEAKEGYIYSDTDSVHTNGSTLSTGDNLGEMKLEATGTGIYLGKKLYSIKGPKTSLVKAKGIGRAIKNGSVDHTLFRRLLDTKQSQTIAFDVFPTVKEVLSKSRPSCVMFQRQRTIRRLQ